MLRNSDLCKNLGLKQDGGRQALINGLEKARENHVQDQIVGVTAVMTSHQPSATASTFSLLDSKRQEVLDLMKKAISDVAEAAASRALNLFTTANPAKQPNNFVSDANYT